MEKETGKICAEGFTFFGKSNRLISHELKNILAIISETMGLLDELVELSERGVKLTPARLRSMSDSLIEEVERANAVIRCLNTFAHSVDEFIRDVDLRAVVALAIQLVKLNPAGRTVKIEFLENGAPIIYTSPFFLGNLLYHAFYFALSAAATEKHITVSLFADGSNAGVEIAGITPGNLNTFPTPQTELLVKTLGAEISSDSSCGKFQLLLPRKLPEGPVEALLAKSRY
jgi:hypothetical protein